MSEPHVQQEFKDQYSELASGTAIDHLTQLVSAEIVEYVHIDAVPRSMSTILPLALCQAGTFDDSRCYRQFDEPLNWSTRASGEEALAESLLSLIDSDKPVTIIEKSTARNVYPATFAAILGLAKGVIFAVRHPEKQLYSLAERIANDQTHGRGSNVLSLASLSDADYRAHLTEVDAFLQLSGHPDGVLPDGEVPYMQPSWREIVTNYRASLETGIPVIVVDGTVLTKRPVESLQLMCRTLGIPYHDGMVSGWNVQDRKVAKDNTNWPSGKQANSWNSRATTTAGIQPELSPPIRVELCPPTMQRYLAEIAMPAYQTLIAHKNSNMKLIEGNRHA